MRTAKISGAQSGLKKKAAIVYRRLKKLHPNAKVELDFSSPLELLIATVLSAQCTDKQVNIVTGRLFKKYRHAEDYLAVPLPEFEDDIRTTGFFRTKARNIRAAIGKIGSEHGGKVPADMAALTALPGVGRKTANIVLGNAFGVPGIAVDTHVARVSARLGLTTHNDPVKIEDDLSRIFDKRQWIDLNRLMVFHGRYVCKARRPLCEKCPLRDLCLFFADSKHGK